MTKSQKKEVKKLLNFAPVDSEWSEFNKLYYQTFKVRGGETRFIEACGGKIESAVEVLKINQATM